ncbi:MAG: LuxR C-terminal-related transcriptional regulator [Pseudomonadota bacterium]|nr:LuxR C-terminal-related transcriptional regulator [Pseudomonadota bacterium]
MQRYFAQIEDMDDIGKVLLYSSKVCAEQGAIRRSYHLTRQFDAQNSMDTTIFAHGYRREWLQRYDESDFRKSDPIPDRTMRHGAMLTWADARLADFNSQANEDYFKAMDEEGLVHGFGLPLFGPRGRDAYASIDFGKPVGEVCDAALGIVRAIPQAAHQRVCVLLDTMDDQPSLTEREREVLQWVARGKSFTSIALILDISRDTVKTYARRLYAKLGASDRVGATVKALKLGLVQI